MDVIESHAHKVNNTDKRKKNNEKRDNFADSSNQMRLGDESFAEEIISLSAPMPSGGVGQNDLQNNKTRSSMKMLDQHRATIKRMDFSRDAYDRFGYLIPPTDQNSHTSSNTTLDNQNYDHLDLSQHRHREMKWLKMLNNWNASIKAKKTKVKRRCYKGIPHSLRGKVWTFFSGSWFVVGISKDRHQKTNFEDYLRERIPDEVSEQIDRDLHRQFPEHEMFRVYSEIGTSELRRVLRAYASYAPEIGYCQGQGPVAATLLMHMTAEEAFWTMKQMIDFYGLGGYYKEGLVALKVDFEVFQSILKKHSKSNYLYLFNNGIIPELYLTDWLMCVFSRQLPWACVMRLWDIFLFEGPVVIFQTAVLLVDTQVSICRKKKYNDMMEIMDHLKKIDHYSVSLKDPDKFIKLLETYQKKITAFSLQAEYKNIVKKSWQDAVRDGIIPKEKTYSIPQPIEKEFCSFAKKQRDKMKTLREPLQVNSMKIFFI